MMMTRRGFLRLAPAVPMLSMIGTRAGERLVVAGQRIGPWVGWVESRAGDVVAWVRNTGAVVRVLPASRRIDWLVRMSQRPPGDAR